MADTGRFTHFIVFATVPRTQYFMNKYRKKSLPACCHRVMWAVGICLY